MNSWSPQQVATLLGISRRRVLAAAERLGVGSSTGSRVRFNDREVTTIRDETGAVPTVDGLSRSESLLLAALSRRPLGLASARAASRATGLSPATAVASLASLERTGLVQRDDAVIPVNGKAMAVKMLRANVRHPQWSTLLPQLAEVVLPRNEHRSGGGSDRLPAAVRHAFWNVDDAAYRKLQVHAHAAFVASRALSTQDPNLLAFATAAIGRAGWTTAAKARGLSNEVRDTARNVAASKRP